MNYPASTVVGSPVAILSLHTKPTIFISLQTKIIKTYRNTTENVTYDKKTKKSHLEHLQESLKNVLYILRESYPIFRLQHASPIQHILQTWLPIF
jgi:hypothetical protein